jgi:hypothetical protein
MLPTVKQKEQVSTLAQIVDVVQLLKPDAQKEFLRQAHLFRALQLAGEFDAADKPVKMSMEEIVKICRKARKSRHAKK